MRLSLIYTDPKDHICKLLTDIETKESLYFSINLVSSSASSYSSSHSLWWLLRATDIHDLIVHHTFVISQVY